jgi:beta-glucuronidase
MLYPQANRCREVIDLSGLWDFAIDPDLAGEADGWHRSGLPSGVDIAVPASWNEQFPGMTFSGHDLKHYMGAAWYQKRFFAPSAWRDRRVWLRIGAANYRARVWVNGHALGEHEGGFLPFEFEIGERLACDAPNLVSIRIDVALSADTVPQGLPDLVENYPPATFDFFPYGGLHRPVKLYTTPAGYIRDIALTPSIEGNRGILDYVVQFAGAAPDTASIALCGGGEVFGAEGRVVDGVLSGRLVVPGAQLWAPGHPFLYDCQIESAGESQDAYTLPVGIRTVEATPDHLLLNGKPVFLRGAGKHEDFPVIGKGMNLAVILRDFALLRWLHANAFRCVHYPYAEEVLFLADKQGVLVVDEVPAVGLSPLHITERTEAVHHQMLHEMYARDKNHSSVVLWCVANEPMIRGEAPDTGQAVRAADAYFGRICATMKQLDRTRPVTLALHPSPCEPILRHCDIISLNRYHGWYYHPGRIDRACAALDQDLEACRRAFGRAILVSEFGADTMAGLHAEPPELFTEEYQADLLMRQMDVIESKPYTVGELIWGFSDFKTAQHYSRVVLNRKGLFTRDREPKMAARIVRQRWEKAE